MGKQRYTCGTRHLACITTKLNFSISRAIGTSLLPKCRQNSPNWRSKLFSPYTWQPAFCLEKGETEQGKYCLLSHSKPDNHFPVLPNLYSSHMLQLSAISHAAAARDSKFSCSFQYCFHSNEWGHYCTYQVHLPTAKGYNPQTSLSINQFWIIKEIMLPHNTTLWWVQKVLCLHLHFTLKALHQKTYSSQCTTTAEASCSQLSRTVALYIIRAVSEVFLNIVWTAFWFIYFFFLGSSSLYVQTYLSFFLLKITVSCTMRTLLSSLFATST